MARPNISQAATWSTIDKPRPPRFAGASMPGRPSFIASPCIRSITSAGNSPPLSSAVTSGDQLAVDAAAHQLLPVAGGFIQFDLHRAVPVYWSRLMCCGKRWQGNAWPIDRLFFHGSRRGSTRNSATGRPPAQYSPRRAGRHPLLSPASSSARWNRAAIFSSAFASCREQIRR